MISPQVSRGAAPIGHMLELPPLEMMAIVYLHMWCEGGPSRVRKDSILALGQTNGPIYSSEFLSLMLVLIHKSHRRIMRDQATLQCFGGDESSIANMIAAAAGDIKAVLLLTFNQMLGQDHYQALQANKTPKQNINSK